MVKRRTKQYNQNVWRRQVVTANKPLGKGKWATLKNLITNTLHDQKGIVVKADNMKPIEGINKIIIESKKQGFKPKYLVCNYITKSYIPYKVNSKGEEIYKGLKIQTYAFAPQDTIYLHRYKPKFY